MPNPITLEICCGSAADAIAAYQDGVKRVELNSDLFHGGLTPSLGSLITIKKAAPDLSVVCMLRPREGGFCYSDREYEVMLADAELFLQNHADGIVFGILNADGTLDIRRNRELVNLAHRYNKEAIFHRAIDVVSDWKGTLDALIRMGVDRVLTSGQAATALEGASTIREMIEYAAGCTVILPGSGIKPHNVQEVLAATGASQVHASLRQEAVDRSACGNPAVHFSGGVCPPEERYYEVCAEDIKRFLEMIAD